MKPTRLMNYKSRIPVVLDRRIRKDCGIFHSEELNRMIDENIAIVRRSGRPEKPGRKTRRSRCSKPSGP